MVKVFRQADGSYLVHMELPKDKEARESLLKYAKLKGYKVDWVKYGYRKFEAVLVPGDEELFNEYMKEESSEQKKNVSEGRGQVEGVNGRPKRCHEGIPNPIYGEPGQPKTIFNDCGSCPYNRDGKCGQNESLTHIDEDGEEYETEIPVGIAPDAYLYEMYSEKIMNFVRAEYPKSSGAIELLLQGEDRIKVAELLELSRNTPRNQVNAMKDDLKKFIDSILIFD